jgi:penicillin-binding protein 2
VVTPVQLAHGVAMLAAGGVSHQPQLLYATQEGIGEAPKRVPPKSGGEPFFKDPANWDAVRAGMVAVVNGPTGTARTMGNGFPYVIAGKSGTAERYSRTNETWQHISEVAEERHQVLFEAFTPAQEPRIAAIVALEAGRGGGRDAAPVVRYMFDAWLLSDSPAAIEAAVESTQ